MTSPFFLSLGTNYNYDIDITNYDIKLSIYSIPYAEITFVSNDIPIHDILAMLKRENQIEMIINGISIINMIPIQAEILEDNVSIKLTLTGYLGDLFRSNGYYVKDGTGYVDYTRLIDGEQVGVYAYNLAVDVLKHTHFGLRYAPAYDSEGTLYPESKIYVRGDWLSRTAWMYTIAANCFFSDNIDYDPTVPGSPEFVTDMQDSSALVDCCNVLLYKDNTVTIGVAGCQQVYADGIPTNYWRKKVVNLTDYITTRENTIFKFIDFDNAVVQGGSGSGSSRDTYVANPISVNYLEPFNADFDLTRMDYFGSGSAVDDYATEKWSIAYGESNHPNDPFLWLVSADASNERKEEFARVSGLWMNIDSDTEVSVDLTSETDVQYDYFHDVNAPDVLHVVNPYSFTGLFMGYDNPEYKPDDYPSVNGYFFGLTRQKTDDAKQHYKVFICEGTNRERVQSALDMINSNVNSAGVWSFTVSPTTVPGKDWYHETNVVVLNPDGTYSKHPMVAMPYNDFEIVFDTTTTYGGLCTETGNRISINSDDPNTFTVEMLYQRIWHELLHGVPDIESADNMNTSGVSGEFHTWLVDNSLTGEWTPTQEGAMDSLAHLLLWDRYLTIRVKEAFKGETTTGFAIAKKMTVKHEEDEDYDIETVFYEEDDRFMKYNFEQVFNLKVTVEKIFDEEVKSFKFTIEIRKRGSATPLYTYTFLETDIGEEIYQSGEVGVFAFSKIVPELVNNPDSIPNPMIAKFDNLTIKGNSETLFGEINKPVIFSKNKSLNNGVQGKIVAKSILAQQNNLKEITIGVNPTTIYDMKIEPGMWVDIDAPTEIAGQHRIISITMTPEDIKLNLNRDYMRFTEYIAGMKENINIIDSFSAVTN